MKKLIIKLATISLFFLPFYLGLPKQALSQGTQQQNATYEMNKNTLRYLKQDLVNVKTQIANAQRSTQFSQSYIDSLYKRQNELERKILNLELQIQKHESNTSR